MYIHMLYKKNDRYYDNAMETHNIIVNKNGFIFFTKKIKYLESCLSYDLSDKYDINERMSVLTFSGKLMKLIYTRSY